MNNVQEGLPESVCRYPCIYMINRVEPLFMTAGSISRPSSVPVQNAMNMFTSSVVGEDIVQSQSFWLYPTFTLLNSFPFFSLFRFINANTVSLSAMMKVQFVKRHF